MRSDDVTSAPRLSDDVTTAPRTFNYNESLSGLRVQVGDTVDMTFFGASWLQDTYAEMRAGTAGTNDVMSMSWLWDFRGNCVTINVSLERKSGQNASDFASDFADAVDAMMANYPPQCPHQPSNRSAASPSQNGTMSVSWQHDPDGEGPLQPVKVTASVEKKPNEGSRTQAKRLKQQVDALMDIFPANVPAQTGG